MSMNFSWIGKINITEYMDNAVKWCWNILGKLFSFLSWIPDRVKFVAFILIIAFAIFMAWIVWKRRNDMYGVYT